MENFDLFIREPVTLDGVIPPFTREETLLGYSYRRYKPARGFGVYDDYDPPAQDIEEYSITICGKKCIGKMSYYRGSNLDIVLLIVNEILAIPTPKAHDNTIYNWLKENLVPLKKSLRYWKAMERIEGIKNYETKIQQMQQQVRLGKILASVDALQIIEDQVYNDSEYRRACREFGMTETELAKIYRER